ncbi:MAG: DUF4831 family protein [Bacteroidaceae bacterium]|nr:DUF4831 family protein [Bacteroidaceae bacterium]
MKLKTTAFLILLCSIMAKAQTTITTYVPGVSTEGVAYYLPKTAINVSITTEKSVYVPGELYQYADRYLRINNVSNKEDVSYTIKSVSLSTVGFPDESKLYHILFAPNSIAPMVTMTESGILHAINASSSASLPVQSGVLPEASGNKVLSSRSYMTEEMLIAGSKAKLAELVAKEIYNIRESRNLIVRGQNEYMPKDAESLQIILTGLQEQEEAFTQMFIGSTTTETSTYTYQIMPEGSAERIVLGRFSRKLGLLHGDDLAGAPIYVDVKCKLSVPEPTAEAMAESAKSKKGKNENLQDGLVYNIPGKAEVKVYTNTQVLAEEILALGQLGRTETLSSTLLTKKKTIKIVLDPVTGALLKVSE